MCLERLIRDLLLVFNICLRQLIVVIVRYNVSSENGEGKVIHVEEGRHALKR